MENRFIFDKQIQIINNENVQIPDAMDDDLFEIAAGLPLRDKKRDKEPQPIEEEPLPNEEQIELDFCKKLCED